ncbi:DUF2690 domain-containing protein [Streptomyces benahoarensis]|uniref:DUF2690 domain-containing protein n=1 Tax=Streptomyces benahoarensis TaxID=2595054 RepID=A0A553XXJ4_9ACTN|nr:DUF2690 domain-containing protein [Streptomyces benahoarensis]TSB21669.1 DUF2690 domain-containing protein [Streptomyces benahoarensis]
MSTRAHDPAERPGGGEPDDVPSAAGPPVVDPLGPVADPPGPVADPPGPGGDGGDRAGGGGAAGPGDGGSRTGAAPSGGSRPDPVGRFAAWIGAGGRRLRAHARHTLVVAVAAAVAGALVPPGVEAIQKAFEDPPPGCPGAGCDGKSPAGECSADAVTWEPQAGNPARIHLRYSASCGAVWGRIVNGEPGDMVTIRVRGGSSRSAVINYNHDKYTAMATVGRTFRVRLCAVPSTSTHRAGKWVTYCFEGTERSDWQ